MSLNWTPIVIAALKAGAIAALICAAVLWFMQKGIDSTVLTGALVVGVATAAITLIITAIIAARKAT